MADIIRTPSVPSRLVRGRPRPLALEQRFVFDGAAGADAVDGAAAQPAPVADKAPTAAETERAAAERQAVAAEQPNLFRANSEDPVLSEAAASAAEQIRQFLAQASDAQLFELFNSGQTAPSEQWNAELAQLRSSIADGSLVIDVALLDNAQIKGAMAAYAPEGPGGTPVIFINQDWLGVLDAQQVSRLLIEEYGHHLDHVLNQGADTAGDEGQRFAAQVSGIDTATPGFAGDNDHATLQLNGEAISVEFATLSFSNAYEVNTATTPAGKETNSHDFVFSSLGQVIVNDAVNSRFFSGNDVSATAVTIGTTTYYGWISRPVKSGGVVRGFYFWTDADFTSLALAQADGNQDGDSSVADNRGFLLVVDQAWFDGLGWKNQAGNIKNVGSSSDRVDSALNALVGAEVAPVAVADNANGTPGTSGGAAVEAGGSQNGTAGSAAVGNVLSNDTSGDSKVVTQVGTNSANQSVGASTTSLNGTVVVGRFGTLTLGADGSYSYVVNDADPQVEALRSASDTLVDTFTYSMADASGKAATTTLSVTIRGANDAPLANDDYNAAKESLLGAGAYDANDPLGTRAVGNVLNNDTDVDRYGETKAVVDVSISGSAVASTTATQTVLSFATLPSNVSSGYFVFIPVNGNPAALRDANGTQITVSTIDSTAKTFTLSGTVANYSLTQSLTLGFANNAAGSAAYKEAVISSSTTSAGPTIIIESYQGAIAVGMTVNGTGLVTAPTVTSINYNASGNIVSIVLSQSVALTSQSLTFGNSTNAGITLVGQYGSLLLNADGSYTYTPTANNPALSAGQSAVERFQYQMRDASGATSSASLYITVLGSGNSDPNAVADTALATERGGIADGTLGVDPSGNLLSNDTTPGGSNQIVSARASSSSASTNIGSNTEIIGLYGKLTLSANGSYTYEVDNSNPIVQALRDTSTTQTDTFIYSIENGLNANGVQLQDSATFSVTIRGANDAPLATDTSATAVEAGGVNNSLAGYNPSGNVLTSVSDLDDAQNELRVTTVRLGGVEGDGSAGVVGAALAGTYGSLTLAADGSWTYILDNSNPAVQALNAGQTLEERFNYTVTDRNGTGLSDIAVLTITINGAADTVAVNSVFVNEASPYAMFTVSGSAGVAVSLALSDSDGLPASDTVATLSGLDADIGSTLEYFNGTAWVSYTPGASVVIPSGDKLLVRAAVNQDNVHEGNESFTLIATTTSSGDSSIGIGTINDEGEGEGDVYLGGNTSGTPDAPGSGGYPSLDDDRPTLSVSNVSITEGDDAEFVVSIDKASTTPISFSPALASGSANVGTDTGTTAQLERFDGNNWVAVNGPVSIAPGELSVRLRIATEDDSFVEQTETFSLLTGAVSGTVTNLAGAEGIATLLDNDVASPSNNAPVAVDDSLSATEDTPVTYTASQLLGNDTDVDGDTLTIASVTSGTGGTAVLNPNGTVTFTPNPNFHGVATFTYSVTDGNLVSNTATVTINVGAVNDAPIAVDDSLSATEDTPVTYTASQLLGNDTDVDGDTLTIASVTSGTGGTAVLNPNGTVTFTPNPNFHGVATFTYSVTDGNLVSNTETVTINVGAVNDAPVAIDDTLSATEDTPVTYTASQLLGNDTDVDGDTLTIASVTSGTGGTAVLNPNGTVTFTPNPNFHGVATFTYSVTDGNLVSNTATVTINVGAVNDAPVAVDDSLSATEDTPVTYTASQLLGNDTDVDGDTLTIASVTSGTGGTAVLNPNGTVTFTPNPNFHGVATFTYSVTDGNLVSNTATVTINVGAVNDAPVAGRLPNGSADPEFNSGTGRYSITTPQDVPRNGSVRAFDVDGDTLDYQVSGTPAHGTVTLNHLTGTYVYTPSSGYQGVDSFIVSVTDGNGGTTTITVAITVSPVQAPNQPPVIEPVPPAPVAEAPQPTPIVQPPLPLPVPEAPPTSVVTPFNSAATTISTTLITSVTASPITLAMQRLADPTLAFHSFTYNDLYTSSSGFQMVVIDAPQPRLSLYRGVSDQYADAGAVSSFAVPYDAFAHSDPNERILLSAGLANGDSLPNWVRFDPQSGKFEIQAPDGYSGELMIKVVARDTRGREATVLFRFTVGEQKTIEQNGRASLSEQLRQAGQRPVQALERAVTAGKLADVPRGKQTG